MTSQRKTLHKIAIITGVAVCSISQYSYAGITKYSEKLGEKIVEMKTRKYARPEVYEISSKMVQPSPGREEGINVVYSIGLEQTPENLEKVEEENQKLRDLLKDKRAKKLSKKLIKYQFAKMFSVTKKGKERQKDKMLKVFEDFSEIIGGEDEYAHYMKNEKIDKFVLSGIKAKKTKLTWQYKPAVTLEQVYHDIAKGRVQNAIFIVHGDENGFIYDSLGNRIDGTFFRLASPSLRSMSFFSCHGDQLIKAYQLDQIHPESYQQPRFIFTVPKSEKLNGEALSLTSGIKYFIRQVDKYLAKSLDKSLKFQEENGFSLDQLPKEPQRKMCSLHLNNFRSAGKIYALRLNRRFIGATSETDSDFSFDCSWLNKPGENTLLIVHPNKDKNYNEDLPFGNEAFHVSLSEDGQTISPSEKDYRHFSHKNNDGTEFYRSSKIVFQYLND